MDTVVIILGVVIVVALYFLYKYLTNNTLVSDVRSLKNQKITTSDLLTNPSSKKFSYQFWLYLAEAPAAKGIVIQRGDDFKVTIQNTVLNVEYKNGQKTVDGSSVDNNVTVQVTDKFPIQKWTYVVINVFDSTNVLEMYINGKLVKTVSLAGTSPAMQILATKGTALTVGDGVTNGYITQLIRLPDTVPVDTVWSNYLSGNGQANLSNYLANYDFAMSISKDNELQRRYQLFG